MSLPEVRAGSSWRGWEEEEEEGEELHRCNSDWKGRGVGHHPQTDIPSSLEQAARRDLQSVGQERGGSIRTWAPMNTHAVQTQWQPPPRTPIHTVEYGCEGVTGNICGAA